MRKLLIGALVVGQALGGSAPAFAQGFTPAQEVQAGAFAGFRLHVPFGGANREPVRAGLAFAPTVRTETQDGRVRTRIGEGLEFGLRGREPMQFSIAGRSLQQLAAQGGSEGRRRGIPTGLWIAGGLVLVTVAVVVAAALVLEDAGDD